MFLGGKLDFIFLAEWYISESLEQFSLSNLQTFVNLSSLSSFRCNPIADPSVGDSRFAVRAARKEDLPALASVIADSFQPAKGIVRWFYPLSRLGIYEDLRHRLHSSGTHYICFVATAPCYISGHLELSSGVAEPLLGTVEMALRSPYPLQIKNSRYPYLSNLAVRNKYRRRGIAQQLMIACEKVAMLWGFKDLYLHVLENNQPAKRAYFKMGYQLRRFEPSLSSYFLGRPRKMLLHKHLSLPEQESSPIHSKTSYFPHSKTSDLQ